MRRLVRCGQRGGSESIVYSDLGVAGYLKDRQLQEQKQIPPLRCGMTTKKGNGKGL